MNKYFVVKRFVFAATLLSLMMGAQGAMASEAITIAGDPCTVPLAEKLGVAFTKKPAKA